MLLGSFSGIRKGCLKNKTRKTKAKRSFCTGWVRCLFVLLRRWGWRMDFDHWSIYSSWLKAKCICLLWTISRAADTSVLGRLEGDLWENYLYTMYEAQTLCQIIMGTILPILHLGKLRSGRFAACTSLHIEQEWQDQDSNPSPHLLQKPVASPLFLSFW